jgi:hypothetical protein
VCPVGQESFNISGENVTFASRWTSLDLERIGYFISIDTENTAREHKKIGLSQFSLKMTLLSNTNLETFSSNKDKSRYINTTI